MAEAPVAEMEPRRGKGLMRQEAGHAMAIAVLVGQCSSQNHVAAAFTIDQNAPPGGTRQAMHETAVAGDPCRMELRIATRQEHRIGIESRCLIIQG